MIEFLKRVAVQLRTFHVLDEGHHRSGGFVRLGKRRHEKRRSRSVLRRYDRDLAGDAGVAVGHCAAHVFLTISDLADPAGFSRKDYGGRQALCKDDFDVVAPECKRNAFGYRRAVTLCHSCPHPKCCARLDRNCSNTSPMKSISASPIGVDKHAVAAFGRMIPSAAKNRVSSFMTAVLLGDQKASRKSRGGRRSGWMRNSDAAPVTENGPCHRSIAWANRARSLSPRRSRWANAAWSKHCMATRPAVIDIGLAEKVPP